MTVGRSVTSPGQIGPAPDWSPCESQLTPQWTEGCGREGLGYDSEATAAVSLLQAHPLPPPQFLDSAAPCGGGDRCNHFLCRALGGPLNSLGVSYPEVLSNSFLETYVAATLFERLLCTGSGLRAPACFVSFKPHCHSVSWSHQYHFTEEGIGS